MASKRALALALWPLRGALALALDDDDDDHPGYPIPHPIAPRKKHGVRPKILT